MSIDQIHNSHDNVGKWNNNEKSFTSKWPEMNSLNTKGNVKQKWGKEKKKKSLVKDFLKIFFDTEKKDKIGHHSCRKVEITRKSNRSQRKFISHRSQPIDLHRKSIYWFCVRCVFAERFLEQTITIFKSSGWKNFEIYL